MTMTCEGREEGRQGKGGEERLMGGSRAPTKLQRNAVAAVPLTKVALGLHGVKAAATTTSCGAAAATAIP
jgi:hypothetical protein